MIPSYLNNIAQKIGDKGNCSRLGIKCTCGCEDFYLIVKKKTTDEIQAERDFEKQITKQFGKRVELQSDNDGKVFYVKRNLFGRVVKKAEVNNFTSKTFKNYISIKCSACGCEYTLFDERMHGYNACISYTESTGENIETNYSGSVQKIELALFYDDIDADFNIKDSTVAFGRIKITKVVGNRKSTVIDLEC